MTPGVELALRRVYLTQAEAFPPARPDYDYPACGQRGCGPTDWRFDEAEDRNVCLTCLRYEAESLADFVGNPGPRPERIPLSFALDAPKMPPCPECKDGTDRDWLREHGSCVFGCGSIIPWHEAGHGMCPSCKEHSANEAECEICHARYADWMNGTYERQP